jgi:dipeptidase E
MILSLKIALGQKATTDYDTDKTSTDKILFIYGGGTNKSFIKYVASLTNKPNPKICYIPTASADNPGGIVAWYANCEELSLRPYVILFVKKILRMKLPTTVLTMM